MRILNKEGKLIVKSETGKMYPKLISILTKKNQVGLSEIAFNKLNKDDQNYVLANYKRIFDDCCKEWTPMPCNKSDNKIKNCQLCGQPIEKNFKLVSKLNGYTFVIGSTCIDNYDAIRDKDGKGISEIRRESKITSRIIENENYLNQIDKNIVKDINNFKKAKSYRYYTSRIDQAFKNLDDIDLVKYEKMMKGSLNDDKINEIKKIHNKITIVLHDAENYINLTKRKTDSLSTITLDIWKWSYENNDNLYRQLKTYGYIKNDFIPYIKEQNYMRKVIDIYTPLLNKNNIDLIKSKEVYFTISFTDLNNILFDINYTKFVNSYKDYLVGRNFIVITPKDLKRYLRINENSLNYALKKICPRGFSEMFKIYKYVDDVSINEIAFLNRLNQKYYVVEFRKFINNFLGKLICIDNMDEDRERVGSLKSIDKYILDNNNSDIYNNASDYQEYLINLGYLD